MEPSTINLDDIFGALPPVDTHVVNSATHAAVDKSRSNTVQSHRSSHAASKAPSAAHQSQHSRHSTATSIQPSEVSVVSSHRQSTHNSTAQHSTTLTSSALYSDIPPEPKTRASTATSQATSVSTLKNVPHQHFVQPQAAPRGDSVSHHSHNGGDDLMASVFGAVTLPEVRYSTGSEHHSHHGHHDHDHAIQHIDDVLAGEDTDGHFDENSIVSHNSYRAPSHHSHNSNHVQSQQSTRGAPHHVAEAVVRNSFDDLDLNGGSHISGSHNGYDHYADEPHIPHPDYEEEERDSFEPAHLPFIAKEHHMRPRTMTMDSTVSIAETRYGGFDVHDEHGYPTGDQIDLHHNEVAYKRPKKKHVPKAVPAPVGPIPSGGTLKLSQLNREVQAANQRKAELTIQVEREKAELEVLKHRKQQSLAKEAAARVGRPASVARTDSVGSVASYTDSYHRAASIASKTGLSHDNIYEEEVTKISEIADHQYHNGHNVGQVGKFTLIVPHTEEVVGFSKNPKVHKVIIGGHAPATEDDKTVLLFGPVGSGKTAAINSMINYLYDVKKENTFRFVLDPEIKKTSALTAYVINNTILPFSVTIVDSPGVVDEKGNNTVSGLIKSWFEQELLEAGAFRLDAISIVLRHDEDNLGWPFIYELAAVKKMFGDDLKTNVLPIITNSEVLPQPVAIRSLAQANIAFVEYYKVNNLGFQPDAHGISKLQHNLFFNHGIQSLELFFRDLQELIHPLLAVLRGGASKRALASHSFEGSALY